MGGDNGIAMRPTRRCALCGRLLFSKEALAAGYGCACAKKIHARYGSAESTDPGQDPDQTGKQAEGSSRFPESRQMELWDLIKG